MVGVVEVEHKNTKQYCNRSYEISNVPADGAATLPPPVGVLVGGVSTGGAEGAEEGGADLTTTEATEITLMIGDN